MGTLAKLKTVLTHTLPLLYTKFLVTPFFFFFKCARERAGEEVGEENWQKKKALRIEIKGPALKHEEIRGAVFSCGWKF